MHINHVNACVHLNITVHYLLYIRLCIKYYYIIEFIIIEIKETKNHQQTNIKKIESKFIIQNLLDLSNRLID
jgi:hypothetical protein